MVKSTFFRSAMIGTTMAESTLFRPATIGLRTTKRGDYRTRVALGSRLDWEPWANRLDWFTVACLNEFHVRIRYAEYVETRKKSEHAAYDGRRDYRRVPHGRGFARTVCKVRHGCGNHIVRIKHRDGHISERIIPQVQVIETARLFISVQYIRRNFDIRIIGGIVENPICMTIRPVS